MNGLLAGFILAVGHHTMAKSSAGTDSENLKHQEGLARRQPMDPVNCCLVAQRYWKGASRDVWYGRC